MVKVTKFLLAWLNFAKWWSSIGEGLLQTGLPLLALILTFFLQLLLVQQISCHWSNRSAATCASDSWHLRADVKLVAP